MTTKAPMPICGETPKAKKVTAKVFTMVLDLPGFCRVRTCPCK